MTIEYLSPIDLGGNPISSVSNPVNPQDAATKSYVDAGGSTSISVNGVNAPSGGITVNGVTPL
jgi:hypothetical protein